LFNESPKQKGLALIVSDAGNTNLFAPRDRRGRRDGTGWSWPSIPPRRACLHPRRASFSPTS